MGTLTPYAAYHLLFKDINGYEISRSAQVRKEFYYTGHTYGEISYPGFFEALKEAKPKQNEVFYDLGSGVGNIVIEALLLAPFKKAVGIEILKELHDTACDVQKRYFGEIKNNLIQKREDSEVAFIHDDFNNQNFQDADILFLDSVLFEYEMQEKFFVKLSELKKGSRIIYAGERYELPGFTFHKTLEVSATWGRAFVHIEEKTV